MNVKFKPLVVWAEKYKPGLEDGCKMPDGTFCRYDAEQHPIPESVLKTLIPAIKTLRGWEEVHKGDVIVQHNGNRRVYTASEFAMTFDEVKP